MGYRDAAPDGKKDKEGHSILVLPKGTSLAGKYQTSYLGTGGMSIVYKGYRDGKTYFIKEVEARNSQHVISLSQEKFMLERLSHSGIVKIHDFFDQDGFCYLVTDFIEGRSLNRLISPLPDVFIQEKIVLDWARQLYDIFGYLHTQHPPIIYRDLKPQNVIRDKEGKIHLVDFGIARTYKEDNIGDTSPMGSFLTASPEHYGGKQTDERSDIYTLGATLHYLLTNGKGRGADLFDFSPPRSINPKISEKTEQVIMKALSSEPEKRFSSIGEMRKAHLNGVVGESKTGSPIIADEGQTVKLAPSGRLIQKEACRKHQKPEPAESENVMRSFIEFAFSQPRLIAFFLALLILVTFSAVILRGSGKSKVGVPASLEAAISTESNMALNTDSSTEPSADPATSPLVPAPGFNIVIGGPEPSAKLTKMAFDLSPTAGPAIASQPVYPVATMTPRRLITPSPGGTPSKEAPKPVMTASSQTQQSPLTKVEMLAQIFRYKKENITPAPKVFNNRHFDYTINLPPDYYIVSNDENNIVFATVDEKAGAGSLRVIIAKTFKFPTNLGNEINMEQSLGTVKISMLNSGATFLDEGPVNRQAVHNYNFTGYFFKYKWYAPSPLGTKYREDFIYKDYYIPDSRTGKIFVFKTTAPDAIYNEYESSEFKQILDSICLMFV